MPRLCRIVPSPSVMHTKPRGPSHMTSQESMASVFSVREPNRLSTNTRIVLSSSCVEGKPAVKPCSYRPSPSYVLSPPRAPLTLHSCVPSLMSHRTTVPPPGHGLLARNLGRLCLFGTHASLLTSRPSISLKGVTLPAVTLGGRASSYLVML